MTQETIILMQDTINAIADMMRIEGTIDEKCKKIQQVYKAVETMMPNIKETAGSMMADFMMKQKGQ